MNEIVERWKKRAAKLDSDADCFKNQGDLVNAAHKKVQALTIMAMILELKEFTDKQNEQS